MEITASKRPKVTNMRSQFHKMSLYFFQYGSRSLDASETTIANSQTGTGNSGNLPVVLS